MTYALPRNLLVLAAFAWPGIALAAPQVESKPLTLVVTGREYRATFSRYVCEFRLEIRDRDGRWRCVTKKGTQPEFGVSDAAGVHTTAHAPATLRHEKVKECVAVGVTTVLPTIPPRILRVDFLLCDDGLLLHATPGTEAGDVHASYWALPRMALDESLFDAYAYGRAPDDLRSGRLADLGAADVYAGVSPWGNHGDTAPRLSPRHPLVVAQSRSQGFALGAVLLDYDSRWTTSSSFLQQYDRGHLYFYPAIVGLDRAAKVGWAWLAPMPPEPSAMATRCEQLQVLGKDLAGGHQSIAPEPEEHWTRPLPDFPADRRRARPVEDIREAAVYTINETILSDDGIDLARKTGSDVLIRGWFKWGTAADYAKLAPSVAKAHEMGALFGGGITCSALYHGENGLPEKQVLDMATRGSEGQLIDAWNEPNCRHGSLSNPAYLDYLLGWCKRQIDSGADYLFMDEINAALQADEGFDDHSIADFRKHLVDCYDKQGWKPNDVRWREVFQIELKDRDVASDGTIETFHYRAYLKARGLTAKPHSAENSLAAQWHSFREARDDKAWKWLTDAIRAHAAAKGCRVLISANGLARYVDLQVLGVWDKWQVTDGRIDLSESQLDQWGSTVAAGWGLAGRRVPVVFFHDWGFNGFPWMEVPPEDRGLWIRIRGAEVYAAGGFFAFPVHGPMGNDARLDGTLAEIARQSEFYHRHRDLYLNGELLGFECLESETPGLSLALSRCTSPQGLILHVINRQAENGKPKRRQSVAIRLPTDQLPKHVRVVSPDWPDEKPGGAAIVGGRVTVTLPELDAYGVAILSYDQLPEVAPCGQKIVPAWQWSRPARNEFVVRMGGIVQDQWAVPGMLQGNLHQHLRNPPTFVVNMPKGGSLRVHVRAVATLGAKLQFQLDGRIEKPIELPDRDGKNESMAREYDHTYEFPIPSGRHRVTLDNVGGDWACVGWYAFMGEVDDP